LKTQNNIVRIFQFVYLTINILFLYKYAIRQNFISAYVLITAYGLLCSFLFYSNILRFKFFKKEHLKTIYFIL